MFDILRRLFGAQPPSASTAKERLRLVLMTDHLALAPEIIDAMKRDLVDVVSRHVEVDREKIEVTFERQDRALAMLANIPILSVNRPAAPSPPPTRPRRKRKRKSAVRASAAAEAAAAT
jgi:cell division topological specificity factor